MTIKNWTHQNVNAKGVVKTGGSVITKQGIYTSLTHGCTIPTCKCIKGFWVSVNFGFDKKSKCVSGITFYFDNEIEFNNFLINVRSEKIELHFLSNQKKIVWTCKKIIERK